MIIDALLSFVAGLVRALLGLFPTWELNIVRDLDSVLAKMTPFANLVGWLNQYLPIREATYCLTALLAFWLAAHLFNLVSWLLSKFHIAGGSQ